MNLLSRLSSLGTAGSLMLLTLACSPAPTPPAATAPEPTAAASPVAAPPASPVADTGALKQQVKTMLAHAKANKLEAAKQDFQAFDQTWEAVEDGIKSKSKPAYTAIEDGMEDVENVLVRPSKPDQTKVVAALEALGKTLDQSLKGP